MDYHLYNIYFILFFHNVMFINIIPLKTNSIYNSLLTAINYILF